VAFTVELGDQRPSHRCPDCGAENEVTHGFIYRDTDAFALYHGMFSRAHYDRGVSLRIIVGDWSEGASADSRLSFGVEVRSGAKDYEFMLVGADSSAWPDSNLSAAMLTREQALVHPFKQEIFHAAEHIIHEDPRIRAFLQDEGQAA